MILHDRLKEEFGSMPMSDSPGGDNLAIALATYFSDHLERPENDEETETGWGEWVESRTNDVIERLAHIAKRVMVE